MPAIYALGMWCILGKRIKVIGDKIVIPIAVFNELNAENKNNGLLKDGENE